MTCEQHEGQTEEGERRKENIFFHPFSKTKYEGVL